MRTYIVDSFTDKPFAGNPAGVCLPEHHLDDTMMLQVARELGLSETAFLFSRGDEADFDIRFFSPVMEIPLCGHATLASAKVVNTVTGQTPIHFVNINGLSLYATVTDKDIKLRFPVYETVPAEAPAALLDALGIQQVRNVVYNEETRILLLEIDDADLLAALTPDFSALRQSHNDINGVLVTAASNGEYDFHSRYFWPWSGTNEDPVTGGTHTFLAKYWSNRLHKQRMRSYQASARGGFMEVELADDELLITSQAHVILAGEMYV